MVATQKFKNTTRNQAYKQQTEINNWLVHYIFTMMYILTKPERGNINK